MFLSICSKFCFYSAHCNSQRVIFHKITVNIPYLLVYDFTPYDFSFILYKYSYNIEFVS